MLCQFTVRNYKSIKDYLTLDMQATSISEHGDKIIVNKDDTKLLPLAVIYGPNGSGKSNVISAINHLITKIMLPICTTCDQSKCLNKLFMKKTPTVPFKFDLESLNSPTEFEVFFRTDLAEYKYNLSIKDEEVLYESLYKKNIGGVRPKMIFVRDSNSVQKFELCSSLKKISISGITETLTLLSYLAITNKNNPIIKDVISWFEGSIEIADFGNPNEEMSLNISKSPKLKSLLLKMFKEMDIDICDYRFQDRNEDYVDIFTKHNISGYESELKLDEESNGTIKLFGIMPYIVRSLTDGSIFIADELDAKLHPKLLRYIIELYRNPESNSKGAQLIFTSHDLSTMNSELFRRDEIWFAAKNINQSSMLYSLVEFKDSYGKSIRKDAKFDKQYLEGRYGSDPYLVKVINWEEYR